MNEHEDESSDCGCYRQTHHSNMDLEEHKENSMILWQLNQYRFGPSCLTSLLYLKLLMKLIFLVMKFILETPSLSYFQAWFSLQKLWFHIEQIIHGFVYDVSPQTRDLCRTSSFPWPFFLDIGQPSCRVILWSSRQSA